MATKRYVCCSIQASNENLDPDLVDFQPAEKKKLFANPVSKEQVSSYAKCVINNTHKSTKWAVNALSGVTILTATPISKMDKKNHKGTF